MYISNNTLWIKKLILKKRKQIKKNIDLPGILGRGSFVHPACTKKHLVP